MAKLLAVRPMLQVRDLPATIEFYTSVLDFKLGGKWGHDPEKPTWASLNRDKVNVMFTQHVAVEHVDEEGGEPHTHEDSIKHYELPGSIYVNVDDVDELAAELDGKVKLEWGPETFPHEMREIGLRDNNGYLLIFGQDVSKGA